MPTKRPGRCRPLAMAVTEIDEVLDARMAVSPTTDSSCRKRLRLASRFSTMASTTSATPLASSSEGIGSMSTSVAAAASAVILPLATRPSSVAASFDLACAAAPSRMSNRNTGWPAWAATCAMPAPMMPAPTTSTGALLRRVMWRSVSRGRVAWRGRRRSPRAPRRCRARG
ncbi:hypothetical protein FQZ97_1033820 [compost metagenome]